MDSTTGMPMIAKNPADCPPGKLPVYKFSHELPSFESIINKALCGMIPL